VVKPAAQQPPDTITLTRLIEMGPQNGYAYLLDFPRSAVPTSLITARLKGAANVEKDEWPTPGSPALMRTTYRANYRKSLVKPSANHPYVKKLARIISLGGGDSVVTTVETYELLAEVFRARGFKPIRVILDIEGSRKALEQAGCGPYLVEKLAKLNALVPELAEMVGRGDMEAVGRLFHDMLGEEDGEDLYRAVREVVEGGMRFTNKALAISLGMMADEAG
jgi:hypothetical protein